MSQYPPPYPPPYPPQQPPYYGAPPPSPEELQAPARRAGVMMIVLGTLAVLLGLLSAYRANTFDTAEWSRAPEVRQQLEQQFAAFERAGISPRTVLLVFAAIPLVLGAALGALGFLVRGGGIVPIAVSIALASLLVLLFGVALAATASQGGMFMVIGLCSYVVPLALMVLLLVWLVQAARAAAPLAWARQAAQGQLAQYQGQQQQYFQQPSAPGGPAAPPRPPGPPLSTPPAPPPAAAGGYHQYPPPPAPGSMSGEAAKPDLPQDPAPRDDRDRN